MPIQEDWSLNEAIHLNTNARVDQGGKEWLQCTTHNLFKSTNQVYLVGGNHFDWIKACTLYTEWRKEKIEGNWTIVLRFLIEHGKWIQALKKWHVVNHNIRQLQYPIWHYNEEDVKECIGGNQIEAKIGTTWFLVCRIGTPYHGKSASTDLPEILSCFCGPVYTFRWGSLLSSCTNERENL